MAHGAHPDGLDVLSLNSSSFGLPPDELSEVEHAGPASTGA